jgi:hypothetical protein
MKSLRTAIRLFSLISLLGFANAAAAGYDPDGPVNQGQLTRVVSYKLGWLQASRRHKAYKQMHSECGKYEIVDEWDEANGAVAIGAVVRSIKWHYIKYRCIP